VRGRFGSIWAAAFVWLAVDSAFPGRLDYGPVVLMHVFQASILALWFSYRDGPKLCQKPDKNLINTFWQLVRTATKIGLSTAIRARQSLRP
jgi:hypothetical protein